MVELITTFLQCGNWPVLLVSAKVCCFYSIPGRKYAAYLHISSDMYEAVFPTSRHF